MQEQEQTKGRSFTGEFAYKYITEQITDEMQKAFEDFVSSIKLLNFKMKPENQPEIAEQCLELEKVVIDAFYPVNGISYFSVMGNAELRRNLLLQMDAYIEIRKRLKSGIMTKEQFFEGLKKHHG